MTLYKTAREVC